ncbi:MAG: hypothetical protein KF817_14940 [Phycisphaeraceae bacterium]|nr:hypothetical protein [Phycisphaeraceae bacterium]
MRSMHSVAVAVAMALFATTLMNSAACAAIIRYWHNDRDAWFMDAGALSAIETITFTEHPVALLNTQYQESHGLSVTGSGWVQIWSSLPDLPLDGRGMKAVNSDAILHFDRPMQALAADFPGTLTAQFYWDDTFLGAEAFTGPGGPGNFSGAISTTPFNRVRLFDSDHVFAIDDLHFVPVAVPGPATVALLPPAAWFMRRRRRRVHRVMTVR